jgi:hypothetical protein
MCIVHVSIFPTLGQGKSTENKNIFKNLIPVGPTLVLYKDETGAWNNFLGDLKYREEKLDFADRDKCKPVLLRPSLDRNLEKPYVPRDRIE